MNESKYEKDEELKEAKKKQTKRPTDTISNNKFIIIVGRAYEIKSQKRHRGLREGGRERETKMK